MGRSLAEPETSRARRRDRALAGAQLRFGTRYEEEGGPWGKHGFPHEASAPEAREVEALAL
jgi:hypothetical protein